MKLKLIVSDIDGTLVNEEKKLTEETKKFLKEFKDAGGEVILATGRAYISAKKVLEQLGMEGIIISYNGARIVDSKSDKIIYHNPIKSEITKRLIKFSREKNLHLNLYVGDNWYVENINTERTKYYHELSKVAPIEINFDEMESLESTKALFFDEHSRLKEIEGELEELIGQELDITYSSPFFLELLTKGVNKGSGVQELLKILQIPKENVVAFGDELNDLEMLKYVKYGVAMENGNPKLKDQISHKTVSNNNNGIVQFLNDFIVSHEKSDLEKLMMTTRSKRSFQGELIEQKKIDKIVNTARYAGSARNSQKVRFITVNSQDTLNEIFPHTKWAGAIEWNPTIEEGPRAYVVICAKTEIGISQEVLNFDMGLATENILLKAKELGYDGCILGAYNKSEVDKIIEMPEDYKSYYLIALGKGKERVAIVPAVEDNLTYYRVGEEHFVPKISLETLILKKK